MKEKGYDTGFTVAITACSSVMGVIIPPSILMVVWGGLMSVSIGGLFLAGVLPGVLIAGSMMITVFVYSKIRNYPVDTRSTLGELARAFGQAFFALMTPLIIVRRHCRRLRHADGSLGHRGRLFPGNRCPALSHLADQEYSQSAV